MWCDAPPGRARCRRAAGGCSVVAVVVAVAVVLGGAGAGSGAGGVWYGHGACQLGSALDE
jgi:hypothetical protein